MPIRARITNNDNTITGDLYYGVADEVVACTRDLKPFTMQFSLGTLDNDMFSVIINDVELE